MGYERDGIGRTPLRRAFEDLFTAWTRGDGVRVDGCAAVEIVRRESEGGAGGGDGGGEGWRRTWPSAEAACAEPIRQALLVPELRAIRLVRLGRIDLNVFGLSRVLEETAGQHHAGSSRGAEEWSKKAATSQAVDWGLWLDSRRRCRGRLPVDK
jgi:hypothetical protein